jgi:hypothetical protein
MKVIVAFFLILLPFVTNADAALILRIGNGGYSGPSGITLLDPNAPPRTYLPFVMSAGNADGLFAQMSVPWSRDNFGRTFTADASLLSKFNSVLTNPVNAAVSLSFGQNAPYIIEIDRVFQSQVGYNPSPYVFEIVMPQRGRSLSGYQLDELAMTVWENYQSIEVFGHAVPEPASFLLFVVANLSLMGYFRARRSK